MSPYASFRLRVHTHCRFHLAFDAIICQLPAKFNMPKLMPKSQSQAQYAVSFVLGCDDSAIFIRATYIKQC